MSSARLMRLKHSGCTLPLSWARVSRRRLDESQPLQWWSGWCRCPRLGAAEALTSLPGVGVWTAAETTQRGGGLRAAGGRRWSGWCRCPRLGAAEALTSLPGVGVWTAAETTQRVSVCIAGANTHRTPRRQQRRGQQMRRLDRPPRGQQVGGGRRHYDLSVCIAGANTHRTPRRQQRRGQQMRRLDRPPRGRTDWADRRIYATSFPEKEDPDRSDRAGCRRKRRPGSPRQVQATSCTDWADRRIYATSFPEKEDPDRSDRAGCRRKRRPAASSAPGTTECRRRLASTHFSDASVRNLA